MGSQPASSTRRLFSVTSPPSVESFKAVCERRTDPRDYPLAASIESNIPVYQLAPFSSLSPEDRAALQDEWYRVLIEGPGALALAGMYRDDALIDRVTDTYRAIVEDESRSRASTSDRPVGRDASDRIWNSFGKHALADPASFVPYYANPYLALISQAWLGPGYRITAQMNNVKPGRPPQEVHRDYHLGFQSTEATAAFPRAMQVASQLLTLQGAVAHVDVPLEMGPTRLLPYSQTFEEGYMAYRRPEFVEYFGGHYSCLPLRKGDGLFFNPALFHATGSNQSEGTNRTVNLLQVSSAFGKTMEAVETLPVVERCWDRILGLYDEQGESVEVASIVAAVADGYAFPTNLDKNRPWPGEKTPPSEQAVLWRCLRERKSTAETVGLLRDLEEKCRP